uniref:Putative secreted protein n=1 Tax=Anopheles marajoara TaxID=58244 RepID=A0A2M4C9L9_9DIPT
MQIWHKHAIYVPNTPSLVPALGAAAAAAVAAQVHLMHLHDRFACGHRFVPFLIESNRRSSDGDARLLGQLLFSSRSTTPPSATIGFYKNKT